jgi:hypothetical protein
MILFFVLTFVDCIAFKVHLIYAHALRRGPGTAVSWQGARGRWVQATVALARHLGACPLRQGRPGADGWAPTTVLGGAGPGHSAGV